MTQVTVYYYLSLVLNKKHQHKIINKYLLFPLWLGSSAG